MDEHVAFHGDLKLPMLGFGDCGKKVEIIIVGVNECTREAEKQNLSG